MAKKKKNLNEELEREAVRQLLAMQQVEDSQDVIKAKITRDYFDVYLQKWQDLLKNAFVEDKTPNKFFLNASEQDLLNWVEQKMQTPGLEESSIEFLKKAQIEMGHLQGLRQEMVTPAHVSDFYKIASFHEEMDYIVSVMRKVYDHFIEVYERALKEIVELAEAQMPFADPEASIQFLTTRLYKIIEPHVLDGAAQIVSASKDAKEKNFQLQPVEPHLRHMPTISDVKKIEEDMLKYQAFVESFKIDNLKETLRQRLKLEAEAVVN